jgi:hypothetical protein
MSSGVTGTNWLDLSSTSNCYNRMYVQGFVDISGGNLIIRNNNLYMTGGDLSLNGRLFINADVSLNNRLFLTSDASFGGRLYVASDASLNSRLFVASDISINGSFNTNNINSYINSIANWSINTSLSTASNWSSITQTGTGQYILASQNTGSLFLSSNYGAPGTWAPIQTIPSNGAWVSTSMSSDARYMLATTNGGGVYLSPYYGASGSWVQIPTSILPTTGNYMNSAMSSNGHYMMVANNTSGGVYISTAYGVSGSWGIVPYISNQNAGLPTNTAWSGLAMSSTGQYMLVAQNPGSVYMSYTYGQAWMTIPSTILPTNGYWQNLSISSTGQYILAANNSNGSLYLSSTFGTTWSTVTSVPTIANWHDINISSSGQYMMAANNSAGSVYYSSNYGANWVIINSLPTSNSWTGLSISSNGLYMFTAINGGAIYSTVTNNLTNITGTIGINTTSPNYTLDVSGTINTTQGLTTTNITGSAIGAFQMNWGSNVIFPTASNWNDNNTAISSTGQYMIAGSAGGSYIYVSSDFGVTWNTITTTLPTNATWFGVATSSTGQYMLAAITGGGVYISSNYGINGSWSLIPATSLPTNATWRCVQISSNGQYMVASAASGSVYLSTNTGSTWTQITALATNGNYFNIAMSSTGQYMYTNSQTTSGLYYSNNYGTSWSTLTNGVPSSINSYQIAVSSTGQYVLTASQALLLLSSDYGKSFSPAPVNFYGGWQTCTMSSTGQYMYAGPGSNYLYYSTNFGVTWNPTYLPLTSGNWNSLSMSSNGQYMMVANYGGGIYINSGIPITTMGINNSSPQYALDHVGSFNLNNAITSGTNFGAPLTWTTPTALINNSSVYQTSATSYNGQFMLVAMNTGGLWLSHDFGATFFQPQSATFTSAITVTGTSCSYSGQYMLACCASSGATHGVYLSTNYGITWTQIPSSTLSTSWSWYMVSMSGTGQYMLAGSNQNGFVYLSNNYGTSWTNIPHATLPTNYGYLGASISSTGQYMLVGSWSPGNGIYLSTNYGSTFSLIPTSTGLMTPAGTTGISLSVSMSSTGQYMGVGFHETPATMYISSNYGANWIPASIPTGGRRTISISGTGQYMITSNSSNVFYSNTYGATWTPVYITNNTTWVRYCYISGNGQYMTMGTDSGNSPTFFLSRSPPTFVGINNPNPQSALDVIGTVKNSNPYWIVIGATNGWNVVAANAKIPFNRILESNAAAFYDTSGSTLTAPLTGRYLFVTSVYNNAGSRVFLNKNGSSFHMLDFSGYANTPHNATSFMYLNAGDTVNVTISGSIQVYFANNAGPATEIMHSQFAATFLG